MNANQLVSEILGWAKRISAICLTLVVAAIIVEAAAKVIGVRIPVHGPDWSQNNALMLAALAYATGRA